MNPGNPESTKRKRRILLVAAAIIALAYVGVVETYVARRRKLRDHPPPVKVVYKTDAELARIPPIQDEYPCLLMVPKRDGDLVTSWNTELRWCQPSLNNDADIEQYEIDLRSGMFVLRQTDLFIDDVMPLALTRTYRIWDSGSRAFGIGGNQPYDIFPYGPRFPYSDMNVLLPDGHPLYYNRISEGTSYADAVFEHTGTTPTVFDKSRIWWNGDHWDYKFQDGRMYQFPEAYRARRGAEGALVKMQDAAGHEIKLSRDGARNLVSLTSPNGHSIRLTYDSANRISTAGDDAGRALSYSYNDGGLLSEVQRSGKRLWQFAYGIGGMTGIRGSDGTVLVEVNYAHGRVQSVRLAKGAVFNVDYLYDSKRNVVESSVWQQDRSRATTYWYDGQSWKSRASKSR